MTIIHDPAEGRAAAIAGMSLGYALAVVLKRMGVLDPDAIQNAFEAALAGVEHSFSPDDRSAAVARQLLDLMDAHLAGVKPTKPSSDPGREPSMARCP